MIWTVLLPLLLAAGITVVFVVLILAGRPQGFVRIASAVSGSAVLVLGVATAVLWATGLLGAEG